MRYPVALSAFVVLIHGLALAAEPDWRDAPLTDGKWAYVTDDAGSVALYGEAGQDAAFLARCAKAPRTITLSVPGKGAGSLNITTSFGVQAWRFAETGQRPSRVGVTLRATDPFLDNMAYSRGRFVIEGSGIRRLVLPAWPAFARVIEDCRPA